ncbi:MAG: hypothetical protein WCP79_07645 [Bacillota bacterium]
MVNSEITVGAGLSRPITPCGNKTIVKPSGNKITGKKGGNKTMRKGGDKITKKGAGTAPLLALLLFLSLVTTSLCFADLGYSLLPDRSVSQLPDEDTLLIRETPLHTVLPRSFTSGEMLFPLTLGRGNIDGLRQLNASCSGQFSPSEFAFIKKYAKNLKLVIIDLRPDAHLFINGYSVSCPDNIVREESMLTKELLGLQLKLTPEKWLILSNARKDYGPVKLTTVSTEAKFVTADGQQYFRLATVDLAEQLQEFLVIAKKVSAEQWLHIHDNDGKRAPIFLAAYDIIKNSTKVNFDAIIFRNEQLNKLVFDEPTKIIFKNIYNQQEKHK